MLNYLWLIIIFIILLEGIYFTKKINYNNLSIKNINYENLIMSLSTKMGIGLILGTTITIYIGGPSSIIWIYIFTLLTTSITYIESYYGSKYKQKHNNNYISGIYFYTLYGLKNNILAIISNILFILTYSILYIMVESNVINITLNINKYILVLVVLILYILLITNSLYEIKKILNKIILVINTIFITLTLYIVLKNLPLLPNILSLITKDLLNTKSIFIGLIIGIKRSIFLTELLVGTTSISSGINSSNPKQTTTTLILSTYFIVFIIMTLLTILILLYILSNPLPSSYTLLLKNTFTYHFPKYGNYILSLLLISLSSSSIISSTYIGLTNITYFTKNNLLLIITKLLILSSIIIGLFLNINIIWNILDIVMLILISLNSYIIYKLKTNNK